MFDIDLGYTHKQASEDPSHQEDVDFLNGYSDFLNSLLLCTGVSSRELIDLKLNFSQAIIPSPKGSKALLVKNGCLIEQELTNSKDQRRFPFPERYFNPKDFDLNMVSRSGDGILLTRGYRTNSSKSSLDEFFRGPLKILWFRDNEIQNIRVKGPHTRKGGPVVKFKKRSPNRLHPDIIIKGVDWAPGISLISGCGFSKTLLFNTTLGSRAKKGECPHEAYTNAAQNVFSVGYAEISSLHLGTGNLSKILRLKTNNRQTPHFLFDYKHGILVFIRCTRILDLGTVLDPKEAQKEIIDLTFISLKNRKILFSLGKVIDYALDLWLEPNLNFSDGRFMVVDLGWKTFLAIDLFTRNLKVLYKAMEDLIMVARVDERYEQSYTIKGDNCIRVLFFDELLVIVRNKPDGEGTQVYYQRDYSEAPSDGAVFGPCRECGHFVDVGIERKLGRPVFWNCLSGKVLAKVSRSRQ